MITKCRILQLPKVSDPRGNLTFIEGGTHVPFELKRVFYLYDVPGGAERGGHALKTCEQLLIAAAGSFDVVLNDGVETCRFHLSRATTGLYIPPMLWRQMDNFSSGSVCLALASEPYDPDGYFRDYEEYLLAAGVKKA